MHAERAPNPQRLARFLDRSGWRLARIVTQLRYRIRTTSGSTGVLLDRAQRVYLVKPRYRTAWGLPGGYCRPDESAADACIRELREEVPEQAMVVAPASASPPATFATPLLAYRQRKAAHLEHIFVLSIVGTGGPDARSYEIGASGWYATSTLPRVQPESMEVLRRLAELGLFTLGPA